jgi:hypothetical protein
MDQLELKFSADDGGMFPMTWGQQDFVRQVIREYGDWSRNFNIPLVIDLPDNVGPVSQAMVTAALRRLVERNQSLRAHFFLDGADSLLQRIARSGTFTLLLDHSTTAASRARAEALAAELAAQLFSHDTEWSIRIALVCADGQPRHVVFVFSHLMADGGGLRALLDDFFGLLRAQAGGSEPKARWQPADQVRREQSERGARRNQAAIRYWRKHLERIPPSMFAFPAGPAGKPRFLRRRLESRALAVAAARLADDCGVSVSSVVLAGTALALAALTGQAHCALMVIVGNRYDKDTRSMVGKAAQDNLLAVDLPGGTIAEAVRAVHRAAMSAYFFGHFDPGAVKELADSVAIRRGLRFDLTAFYNDLSVVMDETDCAGPGPEAVDQVPEADARKLLAESTVVPGSTWQGQHCKMYLAAVPGIQTCSLDLVGDTVYLPPRTMEALLRGVEKIVFEAAYRDIAVADIPALTGLRLGSS